MIEVLWNGRGGQGAFTAAKLLANAFVLQSEKNYALAFPTFGPERRGAPVRAFTKLDEKPIADRGTVEQSDFAVYLDDSLFDETALPTLKEGGKIIVNTRKTYKDRTILTFDGAKLAEETLGLPIVNTVMIGAILALSPAVSAEAVDLAIEQTMSPRLWDGNKAAIRAAADAALEGGLTS
jgi:pyruvate ferredoxin oxidoreductase gamma subunit